MSKYSLVILICSLLVSFVHAAPEGRIVGGWLAMPGQFPYQVSLKLYRQHICGGSIISENYILTAAHCVTDEDNYYMVYPTSDMTVQAGTTHRENGGVRIPVAEIIAHPRYIHEGLNADIALVRLARPLTFSETIQPIELSSDDVPEYTSVFVSGWGRLWNNGVKPNHLQWTDLQSLSGQSCYSATGCSPDKCLCLAHSTDNGICKGDSGGPAEAGERLVGVASFVYGGCGTDNPDGYVKVSHYLDWIKSRSDVENVKLWDFWKNKNYVE